VDVSNHFIVCLLIQVPNIRFNVAKELGEMTKVCGAKVYEQQIYPTLSLLLDDPDRDVRFHAERSSKVSEYDGPNK
jgi:hypothetical protein